MLIILLNLPKHKSILSSNGRAPPDNPVPAPLGTTLILDLLQNNNILLTSFVFSGKTTAKGFCLYADKASVSKGRVSSS